MRRQTRLTTLLFCILALAAAQRAFATIEVSVGCTAALAGPSDFGVGHVARSTLAGVTERAADCEIEIFSSDGLTLESDAPRAIEESFFFSISVPPPTLAEENPKAVDSDFRVLLLGPTPHWTD